MRSKRLSKKLSNQSPESTLHKAPTFSKVSLDQDVNSKNFILASFPRRVLGRSSVMSRWRFHLRIISSNKFASYSAFEAFGHPPEKDKERQKTFSILKCFRLFGLFIVWPSS